MKECVDSIMFIFSDVLNQVNNVFDENLMTIEEKNDKHANDMKTSFVSSGYKLLMTVGLLCSDNNHQLQSRIADKKGIQHIMSYSFNNIALNNNNNTNTIQHIENKKRLNQWGLWALFNILINHPANKSEFYHLGGVRIVIDILKNAADQQQALTHKLKHTHNDITLNTHNINTHNNDKTTSNNIELNRQGLAVLLIMLTSDVTQAKYSVTQARQMAMANSIVDIIHNIQSDYKNMKQCEDIVHTSKAILNLIIQDWS